MSKSQVLCLLVLASAYLINANDFANRSDAALSSNEEEGVDEIIGGATVARGQHQYMLLRFLANKVEVRLKVYTIRPMDSGAKLITVTGSALKPHPRFYTNGVANYTFDIALISCVFCYPQGDSGGPIVRYSSGYQTYVQVGINSLVPKYNGQVQCEKGYAVFTRVSVHRDWIDANSCYQGDGGFCANWYYL